MGAEVDMGRFSELMREQRVRAQAASKKGLASEEVLAQLLSRVEPTRFVGYETMAADARITGMIAPGDVASEGHEVRIVLDSSPFYGEGGGQVGDIGLIRTPEGLISVTDTQRAPGDVLVHVGVVKSGEVREGEEVRAEVDEEFRAGTGRAHTATHVVHWTLRHLLGEHARQAGSLVAPGRLRFDFSNPSAVPRDVLEEAEYTANARLAEDSSVRAYETTMEYAKSQGAMALFGEKYGDLVRVVEIGDYSRELCGGTHVGHTGNVAVVKILGESSIGSGMRRIEALVGPEAIRHVNTEHRLLEEIVASLGGGNIESAPERARKAVERIKQLESELGKIRKGDVASRVAKIAGRASQRAGAQLVASVENGEADELRELAQAVANKLENEGGAAVVLGSSAGGKALLVAVCTKKLVSRGVTAPALLERAAKMVGGGAGGKPILGFAGGGDVGQLEAAVASATDRLEELLAGG